MHSIEEIREKIEDAQRLLIRAMGELEDAKDWAKDLPDNGLMHDKIMRQWHNISQTDDRLGDIRTGRN